MNRQQAEKRGRGAETLACWYLRLKGWQILARLRIDALLIVPRRWPKHLANVWQG